MDELVGYLAGPSFAAPAIAFLGGLATMLGIKRVVIVLIEHLEMRATARLMKAEGASSKQVARFLAEHALARAGRSR